MALKMYDPQHLELIIVAARAKAEGRCKGIVPTAMCSADKVKALVAAGFDRVKIQEQLGLSKVNYCPCLKLA